MRLFKYSVHIAALNIEHVLATVHLGIAVTVGFTVLTFEYQ
jgi:hypothetical protein